jgi:hypothetical protein
MGKGSEKINDRDEERERDDETENKYKIVW